jgi:CheY-like chemotaxis protein
MEVVLLANDLMVVSRVQGAAVHAGASLHAASNAAQAVGLCRDTGASLLIVDLAMASLDLEFVRQLTADASRSIQIVAFGPHVHADRLAAAREAGCDVVLSRGRFFAEVDAILKRGGG